MPERASMRDADHPWMRPLWVRVGLVALCALWSAFELATGSSGWALMTGALAAYGAWTYLIAYKPAPPATPPVEREEP